MKITIIFILMSLFGCLNLSNNPKQSTTSTLLNTELVFDVFVKCRYNLNIDDSTYFLLLEGIVSNNSDSTLKILVMSCSNFLNIYFTTKEIRLVLNDCSTDYGKIVSIGPHEELRFPFLLNVAIPKVNTELMVPIGFILVDPAKLGNISGYDLILNSRKEKRNIIWSKPVSLNVGAGNPYNIKIND